MLFNKIKLLAFFILCVILTNIVCAQQYSYQLKTKDYVFDLVIHEDTYELNYMHNLIDSGYGTWETGKVRIKNGKLILKSDKKGETNLIKMKLKRIDCNGKSGNGIFESDTDCREIIYLKNKEFKKRILEGY